MKLLTVAQPMTQDNPVSVVQQLVQRGAIDDARRLLDDLKATDGGTARYLHACAQYHYFLGEFEHAVDRSIELTQREPGYTNHRSIFFHACAHLGRLDVLDAQFETLVHGLNEWEREQVQLEILYLFGRDDDIIARSVSYEAAHHAGAIPHATAIQLRKIRSTSLMRAHGIAAGIGEYASAYTSRSAVAEIYGIKDPGYWCGDTPLPRVLHYVRGGGFGDWLQFIRYRTLLAQAGTELVCHEPWPCPDANQAWLNDYRDIRADQLVAPFAGNAPFDAMWATPFSLFTAMFPLAGYLPARRAMYEAAPSPEVSEQVARIRRAARGRPCCALFWSSNESAHGDFAWRSLRLQQIRPLLENQDVHWIVFQRGLEMQRWLADDLSHTTTNLDATTDLRALAALLSAAADLVISVDSGPLHLAASLDLPTILLSPLHGDWRFERSPTSTPWYPGIRVVRQPAIGAWDATVADARWMLERWAQTGRLS
ncbi:glycosyltransferase family 9 protein [Burkholderia sp. BCC0322]|uniref:glycosyltransferase family 9 protein n=1 Tax=unclassified Burkholderia TaxID=2613784 RepID=UPI00158A5519|nr:glycosyltransferase family 9 protein [Burkholderia sp. BCC0322]